jgi:hypothetical protein
VDRDLLKVLEEAVRIYGEEVLGDAVRVEALFKDLAREGSKPLRIAFIRCIESRGYTDLKSVADSGERERRKGVIVQRVREEYGIDPVFSAEALDVLEAALYRRASHARPDSVLCNLPFYGRQSVVPDPPLPQSAPAGPASQPAKPAPPVPKPAGLVPAGFAEIAGGTFMMGSPADAAGRRDNEVQHKVRVRGFYMSKYEVTQAEWRG